MRSEWKGTFADHLCSGIGWGVPPWWSTAGLSYAESVAPDIQQTFEGVRKAEVFVADNVAEYLFAGTTQENWGPDDFPCVAPPFELMFVEYARPSVVVSEVYGVVDPKDTAAKRTGWLLYATERVDGPGWILSGTCLLGFDEHSMEAEAIGSPIMWTGVQMHMLIRGDGSIEDLGQPAAYYPTTMSEEEADEHVGTFASALGGALWPVLLALTFVNCKNVPRHKVDPPAALARRDMKRGRLVPRTTYHVLDIGPIRRILNTEGGAAQHGSVQRALHVCRGHFKTYSAERPLFGRVTGVAEKDYRVKGGNR